MKPALAFRKQDSSQVKDFVFQTAFCPPNGSQDFW